MGKNKATSDKTWLGKAGREWAIMTPCLGSLVLSKGTDTANQEPKISNERSVRALVRCRL